MKKAELNIPSISCSGCVNTIIKAVSGMEIQNVFVNEQHKTLSLDFEEDAQLEAVKRRLETIGYKAT